MANYKSRSDDQIWWESQPGNRGKTYPGDSIASKQYDRNKAAGENNLSMLKNFLFGSSDARKRSVEDAVNSRRDEGKEIPLEPYVPPASKKSQMIDLGPSDRNYYGYPRDKSGSITLYAKGGKINLNDCKVSTHKKNSKNSNW